MPLTYDQVENKLKKKSYNWLVTGGAGFIGSNIVERLVNLNQKVVVLDNLSNGFKENIEPFLDKIEFVEGDITNFETCLRVMDGVDFVLHQAALGSVPRSINNPLNSHNSNVNGQLNMLYAAVQKNIKSLVFASSSSVYGDDNNLPKKEEIIGDVLSPYSATKKINEIYADVFHKTYGLNSIGLRYFNVFGKRQTPNGPYAAVIPLWIKQMIDNTEVNIFGDGETSRDFCFIENVIQANIIAAFNKVQGAHIINISLGGNTTLNKLFEIIKNSLKSECGIEYKNEVQYKDFRAGDVRHSQASIEKAKNLIGYIPKVTVENGIKEAIKWYVEKLS